MLLPAAVSLATTAGHLLAGGSAPDFANPPFLEVYPLPPQLAAVGPWPLLPFVVLQYLLLSSPLGEEVGWRGYALPRLQSRMSALAASVLLGALWGLWHLPLHLTVAHPAAEQAFGWCVLGIVADAILSTWLYNNTAGSLLLAVLFHASIAVTGLFLTPAEGSPLLGLVQKWLLVVAVVVFAGPSQLSRRNTRVTLQRPT